MLKRFLDRQLGKFAQHYQYDASYLKYVLRHSLSGFFRFSLFQQMAAHRQAVPVGPWYVASLRAILAEDCGPCVQLLSRMALEAGLDESTVKAILVGDGETLTEELQLVLLFTERVLRHDPAAAELRSEIVRRWGEKGLISLSYAISSSRVYPTLKVALGYGQACTRVELGQDSVVPQPLIDWETAT